MYWFDRTRAALKRKPGPSFSFSGPPTRVPVDLGSYNWGISTAFVFSIHDTFSSNSDSTSTSTSTGTSSLRSSDASSCSFETDLGLSSQRGVPACLTRNILRARRAPGQIRKDGRSIPVDFEVVPVKRAPSPLGTCLAFLLPAVFGCV